MISKRTLTAIMLTLFAAGSLQAGLLSRQPKHSKFVMVRNAALAITVTAATVYGLKQLYNWYYAKQATSPIQVDRDISDSESGSDCSDIGYQNWDELENEALPLLDDTDESDSNSDDESPSAVQSIKLAPGELVAVMAEANIVVRNDAGKLVFAKLAENGQLKDSAQQQVAFALNGVEYTAYIVDSLCLVTRTDDNEVVNAIETVA